MGTNLDLNILGFLNGFLMAVVLFFGVAGVLAGRKFRDQPTEPLSVTAILGQAIASPDLLVFYFTGFWLGFLVTYMYLAP